MKSEYVRGVILPKIGLGTWNFGGTQSANHQDDVESLVALRSAIELGYRHFDTAEMYAAGHTEELLGQAVRHTGVTRQEIFITTKVLPEHLDYAGVIRAFDASLRRLAMDYVDLYLIHWPSPRMRLPDTFRALNKLVEDGMVRHLGVSNFDVQLLRQSQELCETPILTNQVPYSLLDRTYVENGVLAYCQENDIIITAYSPLQQGTPRARRTLIDVAQRHSASPHQIALAWLCAQRRVISIPMSRNRAHLRENLRAADIELSVAEIAALGQVA